MVFFFFLILFVVLVCKIPFFLNGDLGLYGSLVLQKKKTVREVVRIKHFINNNIVICFCFAFFFVRHGFDTLEGLDVRGWQKRLRRWVYVSSFGTLRKKTMGRVDVYRVYFGGFGS